MATQSVLRSLEIFEYVLDSQPARLVDVAAAVDLPKSTVQRNMLTLAEAGWLVATPGATGRWSVAPRIQAALLRRTATPQLRVLAEPILRELGGRLGLGLQLAVPSNNAQIVVIDSLPEAGGPELAPVGMALPITETSAGIAMLTRWSWPAIEELLPQLDPPALGGVRAKVEEAQLRGVAVRSHEQSGVTYLSAVITDARAAVAGAITIASPSPDIDELVEPLRAAARAAGAAVSGYQGA
jgi:IclR family transcriptional regulator, acetate operon repressor